MMHRKQKQHSPQSSQAGFTIIESLLAIIIVTVLMVAIGPVVFISVAARVQARRVERATEAAKTYIDGVNSGSIKPVLKFTTPATFFNAPAPSVGDLPRTPDWSSNSGLYCVDLDQNANCSPNSPNDLVIQAFRTGGGGTPITIEDNGRKYSYRDDPTRGYRLGVRVYRADAFRGGTLEKKQQPALKGTLGARQYPLVTINTDIAPSGTNQNSLSTWCDRLKSLNNNNRPQNGVSGCQ